MNSTNNGAQPPSLTPNWFERNWRKTLLLVVTTGGVLAMAWYKIRVAGDSELLPIVIFTEVAAGVAVFAQALLRRVNEKAADKAFQFSIYARVAMAVIGIALFLEVAEFGKAAKEALLPFTFSPGAVTWVGFFTYEVANGLMLLIEWMFSHLLAEEDYDARAQVKKLEAALADKARELQEEVAAHEAQKSSAQESDGLLEEVRGLLAPIMGDSPLRTEPIPQQVQFVLTKHGNEAGSLQEEKDALAKIAETVPVLYELLTRAHNGSPVKLLKENEAHGLLSAEMPELFAVLGDLAAARKMRTGFLGKVYTAGTNKQGFLCVSCEKETIIGRGKPKICRHCQTEQPKPTAK